MCIERRYTLVIWAQIQGQCSCIIKKKVISLCIKFINRALKFSPHGRRPSLDRTTLNCVFFFLYLLIFILCARGNRVFLRSSVGISVSPNYWYHSKYGIPGYARNNWYWSISILSTTDRWVILSRPRYYIKNPIYIDGNIIPRIQKIQIAILYLL